MSKNSVAAKNLLADRRCENCYFMTVSLFNKGSKQWCDNKETAPSQMTCERWKELNAEERLISLAGTALKKAIDKEFGDSLKDKLEKMNIRTANTEDSLKRIQDIVGQTLKELEGYNGKI